MTKKLYYSDPYLATWNTTIKQIIEKDDRFFITLNETAFYPIGGGQPADQGTINGIEVIDVFEEDHEIYHQLASPLYAENVECQLNWERRFDHMQQHTGQHLLSAVCIELFDAHTVSFHLSNETVTIDLSVSTLSNEQLLQIEQKVNEYIIKNIQIKTYFITKDQLSSLPLRKIPEVDEDIRIVQIGEIDYNACCGTHVATTGELGLLKLIKTEKQKGNIRLHFITGKRALNDYEKTHDILTTLTNKFSCHRDHILEKITKLNQENKQLVKEIDILKNEILKYKAETLVKEHTNYLLVHISDQYTMKDLQTLARHLFAHNNQLIVILVSQKEKRLLLTHSGERKLHCGEIIKVVLKDLDAKGGGNLKQAQISFQHENILKVLIQQLRSVIEEQLRL